MMKMKLSECQIQVQKLKEETRTMGVAGAEKEKAGDGNTNRSGRKTRHMETTTGGAQQAEHIRISFNDCVSGWRSSRIRETVLWISELH